VVETVGQDQALVEEPLDHGVVRSNGVVVLTHPFQQWRHPWRIVGGQESEPTSEHEKEE
jgi:hypothetical protein